MHLLSYGLIYKFECCFEHVFLRQIIGHLSYVAMSELSMQVQIKVASLKASSNALDFPLDFA